MDDVTQKLPHVVQIMYDTTLVNDIHVQRQPIPSIRPSKCVFMALNTI